MREINRPNKRVNINEDINGIHTSTNSSVKVNGDIENRSEDKEYDHIIKLHKYADLYVNGNVNGDIKLGLGTNLYVKGSINGNIILDDMSNVYACGNIVSIAVGRSENINQVSQNRLKELIQHL